MPTIKGTTLSYFFVMSTNSFDIRCKQVKGHAEIMCNVMSNFDCCSFSIKVGRKLIDRQDSVCCCLKKMARNY